MQFYIKFHRVSFWSFSVVDFYHRKFNPNQILDTHSASKSQHCIDTEFNWFNEFLDCTSGKKIKFHDFEIKFNNSIKFHDPTKNKFR